MNILNDLEEDIKNLNCLTQTANYVEQKFFENGKLFLGLVTTSVHELYSRIIFLKLVIQKGHSAMLSVANKC